MTKIDRARQMLMGAEDRMGTALCRARWQAKEGYEAEAVFSRQEAEEASMECEMYRDLIASYERTQT